MVTESNSLSHSSNLPNPPVSRPARPMLTRLDTSERIKKSNTIIPLDHQSKTNKPSISGSPHSTILHQSSSSATGRIGANFAPLQKQPSPRLRLDTSSGSGSSSSGTSSGISSSSSAWQRNSPQHDTSNATSTWMSSDQSRSSFVAGEMLQSATGMRTNYLGEQIASQKRRDSAPVHESGSLSAITKSVRSPISPTRSFSLSSGALLSSTFEPSEIISNFLYLGPEITTTSEAEYLRDRLGIKRIINAAWEIEEGGGKHLNLHQGTESGFEKYKKLPLKDTVEAKGVQKYIEEACAFLDDARLHSAPTYVHCKAGKSRSVLLVMAYLIHSNRWTLQRSYAYVVDRRHDVSPNIGFVAELMAFEEKRLGQSKSAKQMQSTNDKGVEEESNSNNGKKTGVRLVPTPDPTTSIRRRFVRESMPASSKKMEFGFEDASSSDLSRDEDGMENIASPIDISDEGKMWRANGTHNVSSLDTNASGYSNEYRGTDGRYHVVRPPADERLLAPGRRTTLAAIDSENLFHQAQNLNIDDRI
jgi:protein-tyrosine phosphatase